MQIKYFLLLITLAFFVQNQLMSDLLKKAFDLETFRRNGHQVIDLLAAQLEKTLDPSGFHTIDRISPQEQLAHWAFDLGKDAIDSPNELFKDIIAHSVNLQSPGYLGHQVSPALPLTALTSALTGFMNNGMAVYEMGMAANAMEKIVIGWLADKFGLGNQAAGVITSGGTLGNLTALLAARASVTDIWEDGSHDDQPLAVLVSEEAHFSIDRAARIIGLGKSGVIRVPVDDQLRMRTDLLETYYRQALADGKKVICVIGCSCSTSTGTFDNLEAIGAFASAHKVWFHIDGAHGAPVIFSDRYKHLIDGIHRADSIVVDFHKMMLAPSLSTAVLFKNGSAKANTFSQNALYIYQNEPEDWFNSGKYTFECTKPATIFHTYAIVRQYGDELYRQNIDTLFGLAAQFTSIINDSADFELAHEPQSNIVCFRYKCDECPDSLNRQILEKVINAGKFYIVSTSVNGEFYLRISIMNPLTTIDNLKTLLNDIREFAHQLQGSLTAKQT